MNKTLSIAALAVAIIAGGTWFLTRPTAPTDPVFGAAIAQDAEVDTSSVVEMVQGSEDATVEVIEYASFTCPHCANFHADQYLQIKENYIDTGKVRFVYREVYFDRPGLWASMVARCGGPLRYFGITELIFEQQREWAGAGDPATIANNLRNIGKIAGLTDEDLDVCMADAEAAQALYTWSETNREADNITGTPSFIINGEPYSNMAYGEFAAVLDEKLAE
ncbi:DsbA family protein [Octadecabacter sp. R77987]|uniref:DsbA family protein n=1 Tax=Octadecabacter sp. R77987 TaxID=3093874 RepID=UPI003671C782